MSGIPAERDEIANFTPPSLAAMGDSAPVFRLKAPSERCLRRFRQMLQDEGLESYTDTDFMEERRRAIPLYWAEADARALIARLNEIVEREKQGLTVSETDLAWAENLDDQLFEVHKPLRIMRRRTGEFNEYAPRIAMAIYIGGWKNLDLPFKLDAGVVAEDTVTALIKELRRLGGEHSPETPAAPFLELYIATTKRLRLDEDEEKNSPAPSQPSTTPDASTDTAPKDGPSIAESSQDETSSSNSPPMTAPDGM